MKNDLNKPLPTPFLYVLLFVYTCILMMRLLDINYNIKINRRTFLALVQSLVSGFCLY